MDGRTLFNGGECQVQTVGCGAAVPDGGIERLADLELMGGTLQAAGVVLLEVAIGDPANMLAGEEQVDCPPGLAAVTQLLKRLEAVAGFEDMALLFKITDRHPEILRMVRVAVDAVHVADTRQLVGNFPGVQLRRNPPDTDRLSFRVHEIFPKIDGALLVLSQRAVQDAVALDGEEVTHLILLDGVDMPAADAEQISEAVGVEVAFVGAEEARGGTRPGEQVARERKRKAGNLSALAIAEEDDIAPAGCPEPPLCIQVMQDGGIAEGFKALKGVIHRRERSLTLVKDIMQTLAGLARVIGEDCIAAHSQVVRQAGFRGGVERADEHTAGMRLAGVEGIDEHERPKDADHVHILIGQQARHADPADRQAGDVGPDRPQARQAEGEADGALQDALFAQNVRQFEANLLLQETVAFQFQGKGNIAGQDGGQFGEGGDAQIGGLRLGVEDGQGLQLLKGHVLHAAAGGGGAIDGGIMNADELIIGAEVQVGFKDINAILKRLAEGGQGVLGKASAVTAMGHDEGLSFGGHELLEGSGHFFLLAYFNIAWHAFGCGPYVSFERWIVDSANLTLFDIF